MLHPFIPFVTEKIWLTNKFDKNGKNFLMLSNWISGKSKKDSDYDQVNKIIDIVSNLRSFKNELNVSPGSFVDISIHNIKKNNKSFVLNNDVIIKKLGRIKNHFNKEKNKQ